MKAGTWKKKITAACQGIGVYEEAYDDVIGTLADILEKRDECDEMYKSSGSQPVVEHENKGGGVYLERNPVLRTWMDLNAQALAYWRDLGLTPAGFKRLSDQKINNSPKKSGLELALEKLSGAN
jgi:hypothetical protein